MAEISNPITQTLYAEDLDPRATSSLRAITPKLTQALAANKAFLALGPNPTAAQVRDQTIRLTREMTALLRLILNDFADISDT